MQDSFLCLVVVFVAAVGTGTGGGMCLMLDVSKCNVDNIHNVLVIQGVKHIFSLPAVFYKAFVL